MGSSLPSESIWACRACTLNNFKESKSCEACETVRIDSDEETQETIFIGDDECSVSRKRIRKDLPPFSASGKLATKPRLRPNSFKILSYNVWFREDLYMVERMNAIGDIIQLHSPDFICLQEVTPNIYKVFQESVWWKDYSCSLPWNMATMRPYFCMQLSKLPVKKFSSKPFTNTIMGRELCIAEVDVGLNTPLVVATTHLESPCPGPPKWDQMYSKERVAQANYSIQILHDSQNVVFCGDMNWDDKLDGGFPATKFSQRTGSYSGSMIECPSPTSWIDAWAELRPDEEGFTYDTKSNSMISQNKKLQRRLDRFICKLKDFEVTGIEMVGVEPISGLSYSKEKRVRKEIKTVELPVLPSDHYGLLVTVKGN